VLGQHFVRGTYARGDAGARVADPHRVQQLLDRPILTVTTVERDESQLGPVRLETLDQIGADVDRHHLVAEPLERVLDACARLQRDLTL
jgi:hypothetical protein